MGKNYIPDTKATQKSHFLFSRSRFLSEFLRWSHLLVPALLEPAPLVPAPIKIPIMQNKQWDF